MKKNLEKFTPGQRGKKLLRIMKLTLVLLVSCMLTVSAKTFSQKGKLNLSLNNAGLVDIMKEIENQSDFFFFFNSQELDDSKKIDIKVSDASINDVMNQLIDGTNLKYKIVDRYIVISEDGENSTRLVAAGPIKVSGAVTDAKGQPIPGATVAIKGTSKGTITDMSGVYSLTDVPNDGILVISFVGMKSVEVFIDSRSKIDVTLQEETIGLEEVVAIGYGTQRKKDLTSAVGSVSSEDFDKQPITEMSQVIQGRTAGVTVVKASGAPGGTARVRVRGSNSITGSNDPLYVIDGLVGADFNSVNPNDIEDMQILKDASATAIYGSRGANGVVIITTKSGKRGTNKISFRATYSLSEPISKWDMLSAGDYATIGNEYYTKLGNSPVFSDQQIQDFYANGGSDWQDLILRTAQGQDYQLTVSGGNDKSTYYVSGSVLDQDGVIINSGFKRYGLRTSVSSNLSDKVKASVRANFSHREALNNSGGSWAFRNTMNQILSWAPTTPAYLPDGSINPVDNIGNTFEGPLELATNTNLAITNAFTANGNIVYTIIPGLTLDIGLGVSYTNGAGKSFDQALLMGLTSSTATSAARSGSESTYYANTNILTYKKVFADKHDLTVTAVNEQTKETYDNFGVNAQGLLFPSFEYNNLSLLSTAGKLTGSAYFGERKIRSYVGRVNYVFDNKYHFSASVRRDGSSVFQEKNKWSNFPSVSTGWTISEEDFFDVDGIDQLKLRASWGKTGNQAVNIYGTRGQIKTSPPKEISTSFENGTSVAGLVMGDPGNNDLKWETTEQINIGVDLALFNRVTFSGDYFKKNTYDLLLYTPLPKYVGGGGMYENVGEVENKGVEFSINADVIDKGDFKWSTNFNATFIKNEVVDLGGRREFAVGNVSQEGAYFIIREGAPVSSFYGLTYLGTWKESEAAQAAVYNQVPGDQHFLDKQKEGETGYGVIDSKDRDIVGNGIPKGTFGWNNTFTYKGFTLNMFFQAMTGFDRYAASYAEAMTPGRGGIYPTLSDIKDRWHPVNNPNSNIPAFSSSALTHVQSTRFIMDASFLRMKNLSLSYDIDLKGGRNLNLMLAGTNLLTFTKYKGLDPEAYSDQGNDDSLQGLDLGSYPNSKFYSISATINF